MFGSLTLVFLYIFATTGFPAGYVNRIAESHNFDDFENYLPKYDDLPRYHYSTNNLEDELLVKYKKINDKGEHKAAVNYESAKVKFPLDLPQVPKQELETSTYVTIYPDIDLTTKSSPENLETTTVTEEISTVFDNINQVEANFQSISSELNETTRLTRQENNDTRNDPEFESQEEGSSEENGNMVTGLLSAFLGGLSKPDGSIDLDAIIGILGSLSAQNEDGSYNFQGLTDLLRGFFGGGGDEGGGSDIGAFVGGLLGAFIKGVANPPGAKGAGIFTGKIVAGVLPALSGPAPPTEDIDNNEPPPQGLDSGGFLSGLLKTILSSSSGGGQEEGGGSSFNIFKTILSLISSVFSLSSKSH